MYKWFNSYSIQYMSTPLTVNAFCTALILIRISKTEIALLSRCVKRNNSTSVLILCSLYNRVVASSHRLRGLQIMIRKHNEMTRFK